MFRSIFYTNPPSSTIFLTFSTILPGFPLVFPSPHPPTTPTPHHPRLPMVAPEPPSPRGAAPRGPAAAPPRRPSARPGAGGRSRRRRGPVDPVDWWMNNEPSGYNNGI